MSRGSSSTTLTTPRLRVPRHAARLVMRLVAPLVVDYFAYGVRPGASACRAARCRLLHLRRASGCLGTLHGSSLTTLPTPCIQVAHRAARRAARHAARRRLLRLRRASSCLGTSRGSSSTTSPTPRVRVPRHVARLVTRLLRGRRASGT
jgi:hypothetical protein